MSNDVDVAVVGGGASGDGYCWQSVSEVVCCVGAIGVVLALVVLLRLWCCFCLCGFGVEWRRRIALEGVRALRGTNLSA